MPAPEPKPTSDSVAWSELATRLLSIARRSVHKTGLRGFDAEDAAMEALAEAWRYHQQTGTPLSSERDLAPLIATIAQRRAIDMIRRLRREKEAPPRRAAASSGPDPDAQLVDALEHALQRLTPFERQVIELHVLHDLTYAQVSKVTGRNVRAVRAAAARATRMLRAALTD